MPLAARRLLAVGSPLLLVASLACSDGPGSPAGPGEGDLGAPALVGFAPERAPSRAPASDAEPSGRVREPLGAVELAVLQGSAPPADFDGDGVLDDGDGSGISGDAPCAPGVTADCDDNCRYVSNAGQADADGDGIGDTCQCGDFDGSGALDAVDVGLMQQCAVGTIACAALCDVSGDGACNTTDARLASRVVGGELLTVDLSCAQRPLDFDGDGLSDVDEETVRSIQIDPFGTGEVVTRERTSDPTRPDTDRDGLNDLEEFLIRSDPRSADGDGDGLTDFAEWDRWLTSPVSVDTDGDARGPDGNLPANANLFDGLELAVPGTSPSLADTDGDGLTDYEEIDDTVRTPLLAELPEYIVTIVGPVDVRLNVEYEEARGQTSEYGTTLSTSQTTTAGRGGASQWSFGTGLSTTLSATAGIEGDGLKALLTGPKITMEVTASATASVNFGLSHTSSWTQESSRSAQQEYSELVSDSLTRTESASSGEISLGLIVENTGVATFELATLGLSVQQWFPDPALEDEQAFRTVATLLPSVEGITLAPGEQTGVIQVSAADVNAPLVKQFLANPTTLHYDTTSLELLGEDGTSFDFLSEKTFPRTALVTVEPGDGRLERYRVATNVERGPGGSYEGVRMQTVVEEILGIPRCTTGGPERCYTTREIEPGVNVLDRFGELEGQTEGQEVTASWIVFVGPFDGVDRPADRFEDIRILPRDEVTIAYLYDRDADGLVDRLEEVFGTFDVVDGLEPEDDNQDQDKDGRTDYEEATQALSVTVTDRSGAQSTYEVFSDPTNFDADADGRSDLQEMADGTDPTRADTDGDGLEDGFEIAEGLPATVTAPRLYVDPNATMGTGTGLSWGNAFLELRDALDEAIVRQGTPQRDDDPSEIWVARGFYTPTDTGDRDVSFPLLGALAFYGGFGGGEDKRDQRDANPLTNGTVLSGDLLGDDEEQGGTIDDNSRHVVVGDGDDAGAVIDGFVVTAGNADQLVLETGGGGGFSLAGSESPLLRNLFVWNNTGTVGAGLYDRNSHPRIESSIFADNFATAVAADVNGGAVASLGSNVSVADSVFADNATTDGGGGGIGMDSGFFGSGSLFVLRSEFLRNTASSGGAIYGTGADVEIRDSSFQGNLASGTSSGGGAVSVGSDGTTGSLLIVQSVFWSNRAEGTITGVGGGVGTYDAPLLVINSTFAANQAESVPQTNSGGGLYTSGAAATEIVNSIFTGNSALGITDDLAQLDIAVTSGVSASCIQDLATYAGRGNVDSGQASDTFRNVGQANLRLVGSSSCIDIGSNFVDFDPNNPGFDPPPSTDFEGKPRVVDGNGDGNPVIDAGAYEFQGG